MKFGVSYNVFEDSVELLRPSILSIRDKVDYINIIYQTQSNFGEKASPEFEPFIKSLKDEGLVDDIFNYSPVVGIGHQNEINKRNIGLNFARFKQVDYFMTMDTDEFYQAEQLDFVKNELINGGYDAGFCQMKTYYKHPTLQITPAEEYYVALFYNIKNSNSFVFNNPCPVMIDPTRRMNTTKYRIFKRDEIEMHHMSYVRKDISKKINNSSAKVNFGNLHNKFIEHHNNWKQGDRALLAGVGESYYDLIEVPNYFNIEI